MSPARAPARAAISTARLLLRRPTIADAEAIFAAYASDAEATRYMSWPTHRSVDDTRAFLALSSQEWDENGAATYLVELDGRLVGSTGLHVSAPHHGAIGYILGRDFWGQGFATEACCAMVELGRARGLARIDAHCHADHHRSARVLEKSGLAFEALLRKHSIFPNLSPDAQDIRVHAWTS